MAARVVIAGAGAAGLSAAYHSGVSAVLIEQREQVGGHCASLQVDGFTFDEGGHILFSTDPYVHGLYRMLLEDNVRWLDREAWIYTNGVYTRYPFQASLYGLPAEVIEECIAGAREAAAAPLPEARNVEEFIHRAWGRGIARHFALPYYRKVWGIPLAEMETSWMGGRVPRPDLERILEGASSPAAKPMGAHVRFGYPVRGGFQALMDGWLPRLRCRLLLGRRVVAVSPAKRSLALHDGTELNYERLISTMPLPTLVRMIDDAPAAARAAASGLRHVSLRCVHLGIGRPDLGGKHWICYAGDTVFHRVFLQGNMSPHCNPPGGFGLTCEITYSAAKPLPCEGEALRRLCIQDCRRVGLFATEDPVWTVAESDVPYAYPVYDHGRAANVALVREWLASRDILLAGRFAEWEYQNSDHAFLAGKRAAEL